MQYPLRRSYVFWASKAIGRDFWSPGLPAGLPSERCSDLPGSWGIHMYVPCSSTPTKLPYLVLQYFSFAFRFWNGVSLCHFLFRGCIARPIHSLSTLHMHSHLYLCKTRFWLVTSLGQTGLFTRRIPLRGFRDSCYFSLPPLPGLTWRTPN